MPADVAGIIIMMRKCSAADTASGNYPYGLARI